MPLLDITNPDIVKFLVENYNKTTLLSLRWNKQNKEKLTQAATLSREEKGYREIDVAKEATRAGIAATRREHANSAVNRRRVPLSDSKTVLGISALKKGHSIADIGLGDPKIDPRLARPDTNLQMDPKMRPVDPKQTEILYKDIPFFGRQIYMNKRYRMIPEDKFYFPETSGWVYGWRLKDSAFGSGQKRCGRVFRLTRDVKSRSGPYPDPDHYQSSDQFVDTKCGY